MAEANEILNIAKKRLEKALNGLGIAVEKQAAMLSVARSRVKDLEGENHGLQSEINMLLRLQERFAVNRTQYAEPCDADGPGDAPKAVNVPKIAETRAAEENGPMLETLKEFKAVAKKRTAS